MKVELMAELSFLKEEEEKINPLIANLVLKSREEKGCERYIAYSKDDGVVIMEKWESEGHLDAHKVQKHFTDLVNFIENNPVELRIIPISKIL